MYQDMLNEEDPRFKNSKFLNFLGDLKTGDLKIDEENN